MPTYSSVTIGGEAGRHGGDDSRSPRRCQSAAGSRARPVEGTRGTLPDGRASGARPYSPGFARGEASRLRRGLLPRVIRPGVRRGGSAGMSVTSSRAPRLVPASAPARRSLAAPSSGSNSCRQFGHVTAGALPSRDAMLRTNSVGLAGSFPVAVARRRTLKASMRSRFVTVRSDGGASMILLRPRVDCASSPLRTSGSNGRRRRRSLRPSLGRRRVVIASSAWRRRGPSGADFFRRVSPHALLRLLSRSASLRGGFSTVSGAGGSLADSVMALCILARVRTRWRAREQVREDGSFRSSSRPPPSERGRCRVARIVFCPPIRAARRMVGLVRLVGLLRPIGHRGRRCRGALL